MRLTHFLRIPMPFLIILIVVLTLCGCGLFSPYPNLVGDWFGEMDFITGDHTSFSMTITEQDDEYFEGYLGEYTTLSGTVDEVGNVEIRFSIYPYSYRMSGKLSGFNTEMSGSVYAREHSYEKWYSIGSWYAFKMGF
jgi:hypothetical protein